MTGKKIKPPDWERYRRRAAAQTAGREAQPEAWAAFSVRLAGPVAPGGSRSKAHQECVACAVRGGFGSQAERRKAGLPGRKCAATGWQRRSCGNGDGILHWTLLLVRGDAVDWGVSGSVLSGLVLSGEVKWLIDFPVPPEF